MPPKTVSVDGIKQAVPTPPHSPALNDEIKKEQAQPAPQANPKATNNVSQVKASKTDSGPAVIILLTLICMVLLIGLAYFAYNKSK